METIGLIIFVIGSIYYWIDENDKKKAAKKSAEEYRASLVEDRKKELEQKQKNLSANPLWNEDYRHKTTKVHYPSFSFDSNGWSVKKVYLPSANAQEWINIQTGNQYDTKGYDYTGKQKPSIPNDVFINSKPIQSTHINNKKSDASIKEDTSPSIAKKIDHKNIAPYLDFRKVECFYHFTERKNLKSILKSGGLLSFQELKRKEIDVIYVSNELSWELDAKRGLSDYIRLSFVQNHPMYWKAKYEKSVDLIWIKVNREIATWGKTQFTDKNATDKNVNIGDDLIFLKTIDYDAIHKSEDGYNTLNEVEKKHAQSEVLVEQFIPKQYFLNLSELERMI